MMAEIPKHRPVYREFTIIRPPSYWKRGPNMKWQGVEMAETWHHGLAEMAVLRSVSEIRDGSLWLHVSVSRTDRIPTWEEISKVHRDFIGEQHEAYQVLAAKKDHVNVHPNCLHLWTPLDCQRRVANLQDLVMEKVP